MTEREALIEAMARGICRHKPNCRGNGFETHPFRAEAIVEATAALSAIEAMGCVVVPVEATGRMIEAVHVGMFETPFTGETMVMVGAGLDAALAASPYAKGSPDER
jgi:hypothetical protein